MSTKYEMTEVPIDDWIDSGVSFLQAKVTIHRNPALYADYAPLLEQIRALELELTPKKRVKVKGGEESLGDAEKALREVVEESLSDTDPLTTAMQERLEELYDKAEALWKEYSEDVEEWTLRRLDQSEAAEEQEALGPIPVAPKHPSADASKQAKAAYDRGTIAFVKKVKEYSDALNLRCLARAVIKVTVRGEEKPVPDLAGFERLRKRPGGADHIRELVAALESLSVEGVDIMAPHRPGTGA